MRSPRIAWRNGNASRRKAFNGSTLVQDYRQIGYRHGREVHKRKVGESPHLKKSAKALKKRRELPITQTGKIRTIRMGIWTFHESTWFIARAGGCPQSVPCVRAAPASIGDRGSPNDRTGGLDWRQSVPAGFGGPVAALLAVCGPASAPFSGGRRASRRRRGPAAGHRAGCTTAFRDRRACPPAAGEPGGRCGAAPEAGRSSRRSAKAGRNTGGPRPSSHAPAPAHPSGRRRTKGAGRGFSALLSISREPAAAGRDAA